MARLELDEVRELTGRDRSPVPAGNIATAIQALLFHQVVYEDTPGLRREVFQTISANRIFFERYFSAAGLSLVHDPQAQMFALQAGERLYGWRSTRLRKDETLVRIALRIVLEDGWRTGALDDAGRVASSTEEVVATFRNLHADYPPEGRLREILADLARLGAVRVGERDRSEHVTELLLLPGLRVHVPDAFLARVAAWVEAGCPGEMFEAVAAEQDEPAEAGDRNEETA